MLAADAAAAATAPPLDPFNVPALDTPFEDFKPPARPPTKMEQLGALEDDARWDKMLLLIKQKLRSMDIQAFEAVGATEESAKSIYPKSFNIDAPGTVAPFLKEMYATLVQGDSLVFARYGSTVYYYPNMHGNMYDRDPKKLEKAERIKRMEKKYSKKKGNFEGRLAHLEREADIRDKDAKKIDDLEDLVERLCARDKLKDFNLDRIESISTWCQGHDQAIKVLQEQMNAVKELYKAQFIRPLDGTYMRLAPAAAAAETATPVSSAQQEQATAPVQITVINP